jgi:hypothetical protein
MVHWTEPPQADGGQMIRKVRLKEGKNMAVPVAWTAGLLNRTEGMHYPLRPHGCLRGGGHGGQASEQGRTGMRPLQSGLARTDF